MTIHQHRKIVEGTCRQCGVPFTGLKTKKFCSNACRQKAKYQRSKLPERHLRA